MQEPFGLQPNQTFEDLHDPGWRTVSRLAPGEDDLAIEEPTTFCVAIRGSFDKLVRDVVYVTAPIGPTSFRQEPGDLPIKRYQHAVSLLPVPEPPLPGRPDLSTVYVPKSALGINRLDQAVFAKTHEQ